MLDPVWRKLGGGRHGTICGEEAPCLLISESRREIPMGRPDLRPREDTRDKTKGDTEPKDLRPIMLRPYTKLLQGPAQSILFHRHRYLTLT